MRTARGGRIMRGRVRLALTARRFIAWRVQRELEAFARELAFHTFDGFPVLHMTYKDLEV